MDIKSKAELLSEINNIFNDCLQNYQFGEFCLSLTMNHGRAVKLTTSHKENITRYDSEKIISVN